MSGFTKTGVAASDQACILAEGIRQAAVAGVTINAAGQVAANNAKIVFCRAVIASCKANNNSQGMKPDINVLKALATGFLSTSARRAPTLLGPQMGAQTHERPDGASKRSLA